MAKRKAKTNRTEQHKKALLDALEQSLGVVTQACKMVGISRTTFYKYVDEDAEFEAQVKDIGEIAIDFTESKLFQLIKEKDKTAIIFYLKTKAKHRGYIERQELTGKDGKDMLPNNITISLGKATIEPYQSEEEAEKRKLD